jgi:hypothetical protein
MNALGLDRSSASANEIAHSLMPGIGHPHRRQFAGAQQSGEHNRIAPIRLHPVASAPRDQRWRHHHAGMAELDYQAVKPISGRSGLITKMHHAIFGDDPLQDPPHRIQRRIDLANEAYLAIAPTIGDRDGIASLCDIDSDENFCRMFHGSSSSCEDRLGPSEQPSDHQCRANKPLSRNGHTVLRSAWLGGC